MNWCCRMVRQSRAPARAAPQMYVEAYHCLRVVEQHQVPLGAGAKRSQQRFGMPSETDEIGWTRLSPPLIGRPVARGVQAQKQPMR